jgi:hypothetical protein
VIEFKDAPYVIFFYLFNHTSASVKEWHNIWMRALPSAPHLLYDQVGIATHFEVK